MHEHIINTPIKDLPPLVEVIFLESMYFHWTWKNKPFSLFIQKS